MHINIDRIFTTVARNLGLKQYSKHISSWIEWTYEAEKLIGSVDTFLQKEVTYNASGAKATGTITFSANPTSGDSITLNGTKLFFRNSTDVGKAQAPNEILIGATLAETLSNTTAPYGLLENLKGFTGTATSPMTGLIVNSAVLNYAETLNVAEYSVDTSTGVLTITAKEIGHKGNRFSLESDTANAKISGLNLTGGKGIYRNQQLVLPEENIKILGVRVGKDDSEFKNAEILKISSVHRSRVGVNTDSTQQKALRYYVDGNRLNIAHDNLDEISVVYLSYPTDPRGWPMVKEGHETAVAQYIMWQMKLVEFYNGKLPQYITKELERRWYHLCGKARGDDAMPTSEELKQIGKLWNTLVPLKSNNGLIDL